MYPNQGFPGQYPPSSGYPPQISQQGPPQIGFGNNQGQPPMPGYGQQPAQPPYQNTQMPGYGQLSNLTQMPQQGPPQVGFGNNQGQPPMPGYGQQPAQPSYQNSQMPGYGQLSNPTQMPQQGLPQVGFGNNQSQPKMPGYGQQQTQPPYNNPQMPAYGQQQAQPPYNNPQMLGYGQQQAQPPYNNPQMSAYGQQQGQPPYQSPQMPGYGQQPYQALQQTPDSHEKKKEKENKEKAKKGRPTVVPASNFNASNDAQILRTAMKGFGTDESALISVLCHRSCEQRLEISKAFTTSYGKNLISDIRSETSGNFEKVLVSLLYSKVEYYCNELFRAIDGLGTDEDALIEVMCTMSNKEIREISDMYQKKHGSTLQSHLRGDTSGYMKRLMTSLSMGNRDESMTTDVSSAQADAQALKKAGIDKWGTDESEFIRVLCSRNYDQLKLVCQEYQKLTGNTLENDIKKEFSGDIKDALLAIVRYANNPFEFFARRLYKSMHGIGTNDTSLIRLCITRCEIDMVDIKEAFLRLYGKTLKSYIKGDTSGDYRHALYALCGESR